MINVPPRGMASLSVDDQIHHHLFQLRTVTADVGQVGCQIQLQPRLFAKHPFQHAGHLMQQIVAVQLLQVELLLAAEGQDLRGQARRLLAGADDLLQIALQTSSSTLWTSISL